MVNWTEIPWGFESRDTNPEILSPTELKSLGRLGLGVISLGPNQSQQFSLSQSRPMGQKLLGLLGLGQNHSDSHGILSFGTQVPDTKIFGTGSPVLCIKENKRYPFCV